jgi:hypothetical protein
MLERELKNYLLNVKVENVCIKMMEPGLGSIHKNRDRNPYYYFG